MNAKVKAEVITIIFLTALFAIRLDIYAQQIIRIPLAKGEIIKNEKAKQPDADADISFTPYVYRDPLKSWNDDKVFSAHYEIAKRRSAQNTQQQSAQNDDLSQKVTDPSAALSTLTFQDKYVPSLWGIDDDVNEFTAQAAIPFKLGGKQNIFRATIPFETNTPAPGNNGLGDVALLSITILPQKWGKFIIGPVVSFGSNKGPGVDIFALGPAIGAILKNGKWTYGVFSQNLFSFGGDIATTQIQPVLSYTVNKKVSLSLGDAQQTIDWKRERFVSNPIGLQVNYIAKFGKQPVRFFVNPQYNLNNTFGQRKWVITTGFSLILR
jgi:hypothetical protein